MTIYEVHYPEGNIHKILDGEIDNAILVNGTCTVYHKNGVVKQVVNVKNRIVEGGVIVFDINGKECGKYEIINGKGTVKEWDECGRLMVEMGISGVEQHGLTICYDENQRPIYKKWYINGRMSNKKKFESHEFC